MLTKSAKRALQQTLDNPQAHYFSFINDVLATATVVSILAIVLETVPSLAHYHPWFLVAEWATVALFSIEYVARIYVAKPKREYALSFFGIVDLVAILPTFIGLGNFTFLKSARIVRIMRFLRMIRLAKMSRVKAKDVEETMGVFGFNIAIYTVALLFVLMIIGTLLHVFIGTTEDSWSIPRGMYWAFSVFLGGLPAPIPEGEWGTAIFILTKFCGMALFGLLIGVVGKVFNQMVLGK